MAKTKRHAVEEDHPPPACHPLLAPPTEGAHELSGEGEQRVEEEPERAPGHDCCAVCAGDCQDPALTCTVCESVQYCSPQHQADDTACHGAVCQLLRCMRAADNAPSRQEVDAEQQQLKEEKQKAEVAKGDASAALVLGTDDGFKAPCGELAGSGWESVMPDKYRAVYGAGVEEAEAEQKLAEEVKDAGAEPPRKKARKATADATPSCAKERKSDASADARLDCAAQLADRTAVLTYAFTCAHALRTSPAAARAAAAAGGRTDRALQLVVLGAAEDAELADLASWQVVSAALDADVRIVFVGPQVPDHLAGMGAQHGRVAMRFVQATYDELLSGTARGLDASTLDSPSTVFLAFNPGFTCPDYSWNKTLDAIVARTSGRATGPVMVVATNTRVEALMEAEVLMERGWRAGSGAEVNPYSSLLARQSGTLANDLYRKNAWLVVYQHAVARRAEEEEEERGGRRKARRRGGRGAGARAAAGRVARALYDNIAKPISKLLRRR